MTARDELARDLANFLGQLFARAYDDPAIVTVEEPVADALIAAGWRKMPSRESVIDRLRAAEHAPMYDHDERDGSCRSCPWPLHMLAPEDIADAILALMDGNTE